MQRHREDIVMLRIKIVLFCSLLLINCEKNPVDNNKSTPPDEERILFIRNVKGKLSQICTMKPDGSGIKVIAHHDYSDDVYYPQGYMFARWSPDKSKIVVQGGPGSTLEYCPLWLMDMGGNLMYRLIWNGNTPIWTSDGENVIYSRRRGYFSLTNDIYKININTLNEETLLFAETGPPGSNSGYIYQLLDILPDDNTKLILNEYYSYQDSTGKQTKTDNELLIYDVLNNTKQYLTDNDLEEGRAKISPDGSLIAYSTCNVGSPSNNLFLMRSNGDSLRQLTFGSTDVYLFFTWSPNGRKIACSKSDQSKGYNPYSDIFIIDIQTGVVNRLTNTAQDSISNAVMDWK